MKLLRLETTKIDEGYLLKLRGRFSVEDSMYLRDYADQLLEERVSALFLDCEDLEQINSAAIGVFVGIKLRINEYGGRIALIGVNRQVRDVLQLTGVDLVLPIYDSLEEGKGFPADHAL